MLSRYTSAICIWEAAQFGSRDIHLSFADSGKKAEDRTNELHQASVSALYIGYLVLLPGDDT